MYTAAAALLLPSSLYFLLPYVRAAVSSPEKDK